MIALSSEDRLARMEAMLRVLVDRMNPQITVGEIKEMLGFDSYTSVQKWLQHYGLKPVYKRRFRRVDVIAAAVKPERPEKK